VPTGRYLHLDPVTGVPVAVEEFSCAAGPVGWRYVATVREPDRGTETARLDLTLDGGGRQVRVQLTAGGWALRGGVAGPDTVWLRAAAAAGLGGPGGPGGPAPGAGAEERSERAGGFTGRSPAFLVAAAKLLRLTPGGRARLRLVEVSEPSLGTVVVDQGWRLAGVVEHPAETGPLPVARYEVADLATGVRQEVHLAGDVVLAAAGIELAALNSPPSLP
jgi:hypothetical protein